MNQQEFWTVTADRREDYDLLYAIEAKGHVVTPRARYFVLRPKRTLDGKVTQLVHHKKGATYRLVGIRGNEFKDSEDRMVWKIFAEAKRRGYPTPPPEVALLLREKYSQKDFVSSVVMVFHEPNINEWGASLLLTLDQLENEDDGKERLQARAVLSADELWEGALFLFLAPPTS